MLFHEIGIQFKNIKIQFVCLPDKMTEVNNTMINLLSIFGCCGRNTGYDFEHLKLFMHNDTSIYLWINLTVIRYIFSSLLKFSNTNIRYIENFLH